MSKVYFGFAVADSMFSGDVSVSRKVLSLRDVHNLISNGVVSCLNPSHKATIDAMQLRFGLFVDIPDKAPQVKLSSGDSSVVMSVRGLPRLDATRHEYTQVEIDSATFEFALWRVE